MPQGVAWAGDRPVSPEDARERLLGAAERCIRRRGAEKTGITDVATEAGVTRRTVYRYFEDREALVSAALVRGVQSFTERARALLAGLDDPASMLVEGVLFALRELPDDPLLGPVVVAGESILTDASFPTAMRVLERTVDPLIAVTGWTRRDLDECGEIIMRLTLSLLAAPRSDRTEEELRGFLERRLVPALGLAARP